MVTAPLLTVGVVADTHIPDRMMNIHPGVAQTLQAANVDIILHAGDICIPSVISKLEQIAPVMFTRGNRDLFWGNVRTAQLLSLADTPVALMHGHGNLWQYLWDKLFFILNGYQLERYLPILLETLPEAKIIIFGHTHHPECRWYDGRLLFNPGSAGIGWRDEIPPSVGVLRFYPERNVQGEIIFLNGASKKFKKWVESDKK